MRRLGIVCFLGMLVGGQALADIPTRGADPEAVTLVRNAATRGIVRDLAIGRPVYTGFGKLDALKTIFGGAPLDALYPDHRRVVPRLQPPAQFQTVTWRRLKISAENGGHFFLEAEVKHRPPSYFRTKMRFLVDTGATTVALNRKDARALGFKLRKSDFTGVSMTANGPTRHAPVTLPEIRVGSLKLRDVSATVTAGDLNISLLGLSFLNRLRRYTVQDGELVLEW